MILIFSKEDAKEALTEPFTILLSKDFAQKYFKGQNPVGKTMRLSGDIDLKVTGVYANLPENTHLNPRFLISFKTLENPDYFGKERLRKDWSANVFPTYILTPKGYPISQLEEQLDPFINRHFDIGEKDATTFTHLHLQKLTDFHLHSQHLDWVHETKGDIRTVYTFALIAIFILLIAVINFVNLSTARATQRAKEVGVRKVIGALKSHLITQFLAESMAFTLLSGFLALGLTEITVSLLNDFLGNELSVSSIMYPIWVTGAMVFLFLVGVLAGLYPAFYLSSYQPVSVLKGKVTAGTKGFNFRQMLVVVQFTVSIVMIVSTILVYQQLNFIKNKSLGFDSDQVITLPYYDEISSKFESFRNEILKQSSIQEIGRGSKAPTQRLTATAGAMKIIEQDSLQETDVILKAFVIDHRFKDVYGIPLADGRNFSQDFRTDSTAFIINETAARMVGWKAPSQAIGQNIVYGGKRGKIIGVFKDFHFESLHEVVQPSIFSLSQDGGGINNLAIKIQGADIAASLVHIEEVWKKFLPDDPFGYQFVDESLQRMYENERRTGAMFFGFAGLAIVIACLGLFGLASFTVQQRTKEMGIRKVLGASMMNIYRLISRDFLMLVGLANLIALPLAAYAMMRWLENFAYRLEMLDQWYVFIGAGILAGLIALFTISFQVLKLANINPVQVLRNE